MGLFFKELRAHQLEFTFFINGAEKEQFLNLYNKLQAKLERTSDFETPAKEANILVFSATYNWKTLLLIKQFWELMPKKRRKAVMIDKPLPGFIEREKLSMIPKADIKNLFPISKVVQLDEITKENVFEVLNPWLKQ
jgi:glutamyl-tRNA reductase